MNIIDLPAFTLAEPTRNHTVLSPLAVFHLSNHAHVSFLAGHFMLGRMYEYGIAGLTADHSTARTYWLKAAAQKPYLKNFSCPEFAILNFGVAEAENRWN